MKGMIDMSKYVAFKCMHCGKINIFPSNRTDGNVCIDCKGCLMPIGDALIYESKNKKSDSPPIK